MTLPSVLGCNACRNGVEQPFPFSMAFQPIVNVATGTIYAYEALVRGPQGEPAPTILCQMTDDNRYAFDQSCRVTAIGLAAELGLFATGARLSINFMPKSVYNPAACIQHTLKAAKQYGIACDQLILEITEVEEVEDRRHLTSIVEEYQMRGFKVALDDFGAGYSGLSLLADFPADIVKLDMALTRNLERRPSAHAIVCAMTELAAKLGYELVAEGVETEEEYRALRDCGISLMQGYLFARPAFQALPQVSFDVLAAV